MAREYAGWVAGTIPADNDEAKMDQLLYTIGQCCRLAAIGRTKFYELVANGEIPVRKVGKKTLVAAADLKRWAEGLRATGAKFPENSQRKSQGGKAER
jgi:excisionase family DNA binding protein